MPETSVAMTATTEETLVRRLVRDDGQEDLCLATYRPSTGLSRSSALARIHRMTALGTAPEEARGCSSESGIMVS